MPELENQGAVENAQNQEAQAQPVENTTAPEPTKEQISKALGITTEQYEAFNRFTSSNGGFDKVFDKMKQTITNPQKQETQPVVTSQPVSEPVVEKVAAEPAKEAYKMPDGYISQAELNTRRYFNDLANSEEYKNIADEIKNGDIIKTLSNFDVNISDEQGNINDTKIRNFLSLYAKTKPAVQPSEVASSNAPTVDLVQTGENGEVTSKEMAESIVRQNIELKQMGKTHPSIDKALEYLKNNVYN